jgi:3-phosphoshikimate 1-carboxyvinyltransferase
MRLRVEGTDGPLSGEVHVPNCKYHAHRALILASLAPGTSKIIGLTDARHVQYTVQVLRALGTEITVDGRTFTVTGGPYSPKRGNVSAGSSGTTLYFMTGLASLADAPVTLTAQKYFQRRPIGPLLDSLRGMGVQLRSENGCPPITIAGRRPTGGHVTIPGTLSQWLSGLLLLAPFATGHTVIEVEGQLNERPYVELTVRMMRQFGLSVDVASDWRRFEIEPGQQARPATVTLPPDIGSAAFGLAVAALHPSDVLFHGMTEIEAARTDHPEAHFLDVVREMGLPLEFDQAAGAVRVRHDGAPLRGVEVDCRPMPDMLPILSVLGTFAQGRTVLRNIEHVRLKESDRAAAMLQLNRMGGRLELAPDRLTIDGVQRLTGADLSSFNDHRVLMSLASAASRADGVSRLTYPGAYRISYPTYLDAMNGIGIPMAIEPSPRKATTRPALSRPDRLAEMPIVEHVREHARRTPDEPALVAAEGGGTYRTWTWRELVEAADRTAALLLELGVEPGEPVACQLPNWGEFVVIALATLRIGAVSCPIMPIFREREVSYALARSRARVLFVPDRFRGRDHVLETAALLDTRYTSGAPGPLALEHVVVLNRSDTPFTAPAGTPWHWHDYDATTANRAIGAAELAALDARAAKPNAVAQLLFTSGTTSEPKGVLHRLDSLTRAAAMEIEHLGLTTDDRIFIPSPLAHQTGALYGMWLAWLLGVAQIVQPVWDADVALDALREHRGSFVQAATPFLTDLTRAVERRGLKPDALRVFVATGAAVPRYLAERATRVLGAAVCGAWGSTETCLGTLAAPTDEPAKVWGTDGRALAGIRIRVTDEQGRELPSGQEGQYEVLSPTVFEGYLDRPELTAQAFTADGWYRTGDLAVIDESGYLRISGRIRDVINRGGEKVPVGEIEQLMHEHPAVREVAIVAMPDERLGERACAFVVLEDGASLDLDALRAFLDERRVAKQYWPERVEAIAALPRNATGKVQKFILRERAKTLRPHRDAVRPGEESEGRE